MDNIPFYIYVYNIYMEYNTYYIFFIHLPINGRLSYFHILAIWDTDYISFGYTPSRGITESYDSSILKFWRTSYRFP